MVFKFDIIIMFKFVEKVYIYIIGKKIIDGGGTQWMNQDL